MNSTFLKKALPHFIAIGVFLLVAIVYCRPALQGKVVQQTDMLQYKAMAQQSFEYKEKHGHFPLWSESAFGGMPAYTIAIDPTSKFSFGILGNILMLGLPQPINYFFLACICFYILATVLKINPWIGILASLAYAYCSYDPVIIFTGHVTKMLAIGYAPAVIGSLLLLFRKQYLWGTALLTLFLALQLNSNHLQIVYYTLISMGLLTIFYFVYSARQGQLKEMLIGLVFAVIAVGVAYGSSTAGTLPMQEYTQETMRGGRTELEQLQNKSGARAGLDRDYAFQWSYGIGETLTLAVPGIYGGGNGGSQIGDNSKFADHFSQEFGASSEQGVASANNAAYWGAQPFTMGPVYLGAVVCFLFIFGLVYIKGWSKWWLLSVAVVGILLSWGKNFGVLNNFLFDHLPLYNKFRAPSTALWLPQLAFPLLGALGLDQLLKDGITGEFIWKKFMTAVYATGALLILLIGFYFSASYKSDSDGREKDQWTQMKMQQLSQGRQGGADVQAQAMATGSTLLKALQEDRQSLYGTDLIRAILLIGLSAVLLGFFLKKKVNTMILLGGLIVLSTYDLLAISSRYLNQDSYVDEGDLEASLAATPADQQIKSDPEKNFRVLDETSQGNPFENASASYHHNSLGGYSPAKLGLYQDLIDSQFRKGNMQAYNMMNTKYILQRDPSSGQAVARINPAAFGSCWLVKAIHYVADGKEEMKALDSVNVRDTAIVQQKFSSLIKALPVPDSTAKIQLVDNDNDHLTYKFSARTNQFAVFSEVYYDKGWDAFIDGAKVDYCRVNYILRGMAVPAGDHTIEFKFEPHSYYVGNTITVWSTIFIYLLLIAAFAVEIRNFNKKKTPVTS